MEEEEYDIVGRRSQSLLLANYLTLGKTFNFFDAISTSVKWSIILLLPISQIYGEKDDV